MPSTTSVSKRSRAAAAASARCAHVGAPVRQIGERRASRRAPLRRARDGRDPARARAPPASSGARPSAPTARREQPIQVEPDRHGLAPATAPMVRHRARGVARAPGRVKAGGLPDGVGRRRHALWSAPMARDKVAADVAALRDVLARAACRRRAHRLHQRLLRPAPSRARALPRGRARARRRRWSSGSTTTPPSAA